MFMIMPFPPPTPAIHVTIYLFPHIMCHPADSLSPSSSGTRQPAPCLNQGHIYGQDLQPGVAVDGQGSGQARRPGQHPQDKSRPGVRPLRPGQLRDQPQHSPARCGPQREATGGVYGGSTGAE